MSTLAGRRIVITRAREQASELGALLKAEGATVLELPLIEMQAPEDWGPADAAAFHLPDYSWIVFTSANAVRWFDSRLSSKETKAHVCCIGSKTKSVAERLGWRVSLVPAEYVAESVVAAFSGKSLAAQRVLMPRAAVARDLVPQALRDLGAEVDVVDVYRNVVPADAVENARRMFVEGERPHWVTFTSSSTVKHLLEVISKEALVGVRAASIGPVTTETAVASGIRIDTEAVPHTLEGLVAAISAAESQR